MGCSEDEDASGDGKVTLKFWVFGSAGYEQLAEEYMEDHPDVNIEINHSEMNDLHNNLFTSISAGSGAPDITMIEVSAIAKFMEAQDRFYNLYDFGAEDIKDQYLDWKWNMAESPDGSYLIGLPTDIGPTTMFYRTDVFEEAGLPTDPDEVSSMFQTWEDFFEIGKQIKAETGKPIVDGPELLYNALRDQADQQYFNENDELIIEGNSAVKEAYDFTARLIEEGLVGQNELWTPEWGNAMADGSYGVLLAPSWMVANVKENAPDASGKWRITTMPEGAGNWGGSYIAIPKESEHPEEAYAFIEWLVSPENQLTSFKNNGLFPSALPVYEESDFIESTDDYFGGQQVAKIFSEAAEQVKPVYMGKNHAIVQTEIVNALMNVVTKGTDPEAEWDEALTRIKAQLERQ
ncbi:carbohydrate ABC transporter substrate-binding protein (CUT1 family) [Melghiribacillus thermohalophilus]|uniref:Carbohydrate ABC transporter substrate-binding protein (CUT1 family) n=1 Tax=Melghiribacillus thermohalophilus TaxID=1324956 RepID=A0A4R3MW86_9BACI|nr:carbohydrate ABC transporter substrate-binding protein (CUT1 family) [Melghiribacillus thermohalophilus]